jgi:hypothetical protein
LPAMSRRNEISRTDPVLRFAAGTLIFVFLLRALIPAGFMPDAKAAGEGRFELVICTSAGERLVQGIDLDASGDKPATWSGADCPYHHSLSQAFTAPALAPVPVEFAAGAARAPLLAATELLPPALGPPLGQRAPPFFLA